MHSESTGLGQAGNFPKYVDLLSRRHYVRPISSQWKALSESFSTNQRLLPHLWAFNPAYKLLRHQRVIH